MSKPYTIDVKKCLGKGATAEVFLGIRNEDATQCAMKCSRHQLKKEISILKDLDHSNIVRFYESLTKFCGYENVIVMEYCNKGSLYDFIELHQGLCDNMLLKMLECLNQGIHYLRMKQLVHRDIKPGNMMVHEDSMGYYHIKLGDMGTAKRVEDDQTFPSLVGTEEYLHPDMYIRYLEGLNTTHRANVDLWSIGVTLYHAVVTELPFLPHNYNRASERAKETLKFMYETKKPGIICGKQNSENKSDITWSNMLPDKCRLSKMLKEKTSQLIGILMERTENNTYERFFEESRKILNLKRALMMNSVTGELQYLYLDNLSYSNLIENVSKMIGYPREDFIMLTKLKRMEPLSEVQGECLQSIPVKGHLKYELTDDTLLVMVTKQTDYKMDNLVCKELNIICDGPKSRYTYHKETVKYSDQAMKSIYQVSNATNYIDCQVDCIKALVTSFNENVMIDQLKLLNEALPWQMKAIRDTSLMTESLVNITRMAITHADTSLNNQEGLDKCKSEIDQLRQKATEGEKCGEQYHLKIVERREMVKYSKRQFDNEDLRDKSWDDSLAFLVHLSEELVNEVKLMPEDRMINDETYKLEIWQRHIRLYKYYQTAKEKHLGKQKHVKALHNAFFVWTKQALNVMGRVTMLRDFLKRQEERRSSLRTKFLQVNEFLEKILSSTGLVDNIKEVPDTLFVSNNSAIQSAILEIKDLTEKTKQAYFKSNK